MTSRPGWIALWLWLLIKPVRKGYRPVSSWQRDGPQSGVE